MIPSLSVDAGSTRLAALHSDEILDTRAKAEFDDFTVLAARICAAPICLISLVDAPRPWFKSVFGRQVQETPREYSFCSYAICEAKMPEVSDARRDPRFVTNPLDTGEPRVRFYAGAPLVAGDGDRLGSLRVIDRVAARHSTLPRKAALAPPA